jgi:hypothetical protein
LFEPPAHKGLVGALRINLVDIRRTFRCSIRILGASLVLRTDSQISEAQLSSRKICWDRLDHGDALTYQIWTTPNDWNRVCTHQKRSPEGDIHKRTSPKVSLHLGSRIHEARDYYEEAEEEAQTSGKRKPSSAFDTETEQPHALSHTYTTLLKLLATTSQRSERNRRCRR